MNRALLYFVLSSALISWFEGVSAAQTVTQVAAGNRHSLFVMSDGMLWGMGDNMDGQLGLGLAVNGAKEPQMIVSSNVTAVACGYHHSLFTESGGSLWAMGYNFDGELGNGNNLNHYVPEQIVGSSVSVIGGGCAAFHSIFAKFQRNGSLWTMGYNFYGQLGDGTFTSTNTPQDILNAGLLSYAATAVAAGSRHSLFIRGGGSLWGMGDNSFGQLGLGPVFSGTNLAAEIVSSNVTAIAAGDIHSLFVKSDGTLWAMGQDEFGQLGDGTNTTQFTPEGPIAFSVTAVAAGNNHSLYIKSDGSLWGMGDNANGQLGVGDNSDRHSPVLIVPNNVVAVAAGAYHSLFIKSDGSLWAMGFNGDGQLGDGTYTDRHSPVQIVPPAPPRPGITNLSLAGMNVVLNGTNGQSGRTYNTLMSTNVTLPLNQWTLVGISSLTADGNFSITATNAVSANYPEEFFILQLQN